MQPQNRIQANEITGGYQYNFPGAVEMNGGGRAAPPLPPRPYQTPTYGSTTSGYMASPTYGSYAYGGYSSPYSYGLYGGSYSSPYGMRYGQPYGGGYDPENGFIAAAEESSQAAFQSIESVVRAFSSISMMLESTFGAVYSTFRAVLGVAENFSRVKNNFTAVMSALAIMKTLKWLLKKVLYIIGIEKENPAREAWSAALGPAGTAGALTESDIKRTKSSWPILMYFAIISAAPYLMWRILASLTSSASKDDKRWANGETEHYLAVAEYNFSPASEKEIGFKSGQQIILAPKELQPRVRGWLLASVDGKKTGLVPANYIRILGKQGPRQLKVPTATHHVLKPSFENVTTNVSSNTVESSVQSEQVQP